MVEYKKDGIQIIANLENIDILSQIVLCIQENDVYILKRQNYKENAVYVWKKLILPSDSRIYYSTAQEACDVMIKINGRIFVVGNNELVDMLLKS
jgi:hypothetical protein